VELGGGETLNFPVITYYHLSGKVFDWGFPPKNICLHWNERLAKIKEKIFTGKTNK